MDSHIKVCIRPKPTSNIEGQFLRMIDNNAIVNIRTRETYTFSNNYT